MIQRAQAYFINLAQKSKIPAIIDASQEQYKLGVLRVLLGLLMLARNTEIVYTAWYFDYTSNTMVFAATYLVLLFVFTLGFALPVITPVLFFLYCFGFNKYLGTDTLGNTTCLQLIAVLMFVNHGYRFSLDSFFLKTKGRGARIIHRSYAIVGLPDKKHYKTIYFYGLCAYGLVSFSAFTLHIKDPHWLNGSTIHILLTNAYLCKHYEFFRYIEGVSPVLLKWISYAGLIGQSIFQLLMIPLLFWKRGSWWVKSWGWLFFLLSVITIQLSYLPHVEMILWFLIFHRFNFLKIRPLTIPQGLLSSTYRVNYALFFYTLTFTGYVLLRFPLVSRYSVKTTIQMLGKANYRQLDEALYRLGYDSPHVFNKSDLSMGNNWVVIERKPLYTAEPYVMVPFTGYQGERRSYFLKYDYLLFSNHGSDILYFRMILPDRRRYSFRQGQSKKMIISQEDKQSIEQLIRFDYKYHKFAHPYSYRATLYTSQSNDLSLEPEVRYKKTLADRVEISIGN